MGPMDPTAGTTPGAARPGTRCARLLALRAKGFLALTLLAAVLRLPSLAARPMHADEAIHADKFGTLLEGGGYAYDPTEYHGPTLYYMTLVPAWLRGESRYVAIDEVTLRAVPAVLGVALVATHFAARGALGAAAAALAAFLAAISPAMVFYSRYYIHEIPLVLFTFGALLAARRYQQAPGLSSAVLLGVFAGLMVATKETAPLALGCMAVAAVLTRFTARHLVGGSPPMPGRAVAGHALGAGLAGVLVAALLFSSFLTHPRGVLDGVLAYPIYLDRAGTVSSHVHPWFYYLGLLAHFPAQGAPFWSEGIILILALLGAAAGWVGNGVPGADPRVIRFLAFYTMLMLVVYGAIPYKTPWCLLGFLHGLILLAGAGGVFILLVFRGTAARSLVAMGLVCASGHLAWQAYQGSFRLAADPRNPYVYAHTSTDVFEIARRVTNLARAHPAGSAMPLLIVSRENLWPLPFYLRGLSKVGWWNGVPDQAAKAPVVLLTPDMEPELVRKIYDLPPPGERELYVNIFERQVELRPGVELLGYAQNTLWQEFRRREAEAPGPGGTARP